MDQRVAPGEEEPTGQTRRLLLLGGLSLIGLVVVTVWLAGSSADGVADNGSVPADGTVAEVGATSDDPGQAGANEATPTGNEETGASPAATESGSFTPGADELVALSVEACSQFAEGATVADFAAWFEANLDEGIDAEATFRSVLIRALTEQCPEVIPDS